jgi:hypothetical protein
MRSFSTIQSSFKQKKMDETTIKYLIQQPHVYKADATSGQLELSPIKINEECRKEWNIDMNDFVVLAKNGNLISNSLYRVGGFGLDMKQDYLLLLKYREAIYDYAFIKQCYPNKDRKWLESQRKHLEGCWCIIDKNGIEKKVFDPHKSPYIKRGSCVYSVDGYHHNIETDELYCHSSKIMESSEYLFLENPYDKDVSKIGVMKINKKDGSWTVFS